jgi:hypothetical protein
MRAIRQAGTAAILSDVTTRFRETRKSRRELAGALRVHSNGVMMAPPGKMGHVSEDNSTS